MEIKFKAVVKEGGIATHAVNRRTRVDLELSERNSLAFAELIELYEDNFIITVHVKGDKGSDYEFDAVVWKVRMAADRGIVFTFEMDAGNALSAAKLNDSQILGELLDVTVTSEGVTYAKGFYGKFKRETKKRDIPN